MTLYLDRYQLTNGFFNVWMSDPLRATSSVTTKSVYGLTADHGCEHRLASFHEVPSFVCVVNCFLL